VPAFIFQYFQYPSYLWQFVATPQIQIAAIIAAGGNYLPAKAIMTLK
jgi:hypothetical protein